GLIVFIGLHILPLVGPLTAPYHSFRMIGAVYLWPLPKINLFMSGHCVRDAPHRLLSHSAAGRVQTHHPNQLHYA
ncbi:MAG: hypothetical protein COB24_12695, partial [Hyphomicrobiales bacterium]